MGELAQLLISSGAVKFGDFTLTSGRKSSFYVDVKKASTKPEILDQIAREMSELVGNENLLAGMELGAVPIVVALALETKKDYVILRKGRQIEGDFHPGEKVLIVEDVATTGGSAVRSAEILREAGLIVDRVLVVVDREEGGKESLAEIGVELLPLVRMSELKKD